MFNMKISKSLNDSLHKAFNPIAPVTNCTVIMIYLFTMIPNYDNI